MASKSKYGKHELEELWVKAGGPKAQAQIAAAIALAESKGVPTAKNPEGPEHAEGLWQIKGQLISGNPFNPEVSAANAVAKWKAAKGFSPWTTYTGGEYKKYLSEGLPELIPGEDSVPVIGGISEFLTGQGKGLAESINEATKPIRSTGEFLEALTSPNTWLRLAEGIGGIVLFMIGLKTLTKGTAAAGATNVAINQGRSVKGAVVKAGKVAVGVAK
jgi:Lysozyme like domain